MKKIKKVVLGLSFLGLIFNYMEAYRYGVQWGFGLRNFDMDTFFGIGVITLIILVITALMKVKSKFYISILIGCLYGFKKAFNLYSLSNGMFGMVSLFAANHTVTITLGTILLVTSISIIIELEKVK